MKKSLIQILGLLGIVSFISYLCGVIFAPLAYPNYDWLSQAVSDLSAQNAPSLQLWNQLTALYNICEVVCVILVCISVSIDSSSKKKMKVFLLSFCFSLTLHYLCYSLNIKRRVKPFLRNLINNIK